MKRLFAILMVISTVMLTSCTADEAQTLSVIDTEDTSIAWFSGIYQSQQLPNTEPMVRQGNVIRIDLRTNGTFQDLDQIYTFNTQSDYTEIIDNMTVKITRGQTVFRFIKVSGGTNIAVQVFINNHVHYIGQYTKID